MERRVCLMEMEMVFVGLFSVRRNREWDRSENERRPPPSSFSLEFFCVFFFSFACDFIDVLWGVLQEEERGEMLLGEPCMEEKNVNKEMVDRKGVGERKSMIGELSFYFSF